LQVSFDPPDNLRMFAYEMMRLVGLMPKEAAELTELALAAFKKARNRMMR
jgi:hypothetical protein